MSRIDRIAEPWGTRTPYGPGEAWPTRVDSYLAGGFIEADVDRWVLSATTRHSNGDGLDIAVKDGRIAGVRGRAVDRVNHGRLGPKDLFGWQANNSPDRLTRPLIRRDGELVECDWDAAMDAVVGRCRELLDERGPSPIAFYTTGQLFLEEYYTLGLIAHGGIGTNHVDGNTRLCTATAAAALKESFASDGQPGSYTDVDSADVIALYGHNMAETQTVLWTRILDRLAGPKPPAIVCVDPRETRLRELPPCISLRGPGTNVMLMNALLHEILGNGGIDREYVEAHALGFQELEMRVKDYPPEVAAEVCDVPVEQIREAARLIGRAERLLSTVLQTPAGRFGPRRRRWSAPPAGPLVPDARPAPGRAFRAAPARRAPGGARPDGGARAAVRLRRPVAPRAPAAGGRGRPTGAERTAGRRPRPGTGEVAAAWWSARRAGRRRGTGRAPRSSGRSSRGRGHGR